MPANTEWQKVFKKAVGIAKELKKKDSKLTYPEAVKKAWKTPEMKKAKADFDKKHKK